jgi:hypothetical protein
MKIWNYTLCTLLWLVPLGLAAQHRWEGALFGGGANYQGDLVPTLHPYPEETNISVGLLTRYFLNQQWAMRLGVTYGELSGTDAHFDDRYFRDKRRFSFNSQLVEAALLLEWEPFGNWRYKDRDSFKFKKIISPYLFAGGATAMSDVQVNFGDYQNGEPSPGVQADRAAKYPQQIFSLPFGLGFKIDVSRKVSLGLEAGTRLAFTDYLDGVSQSANPKERDWYTFAGATVTVRFFAKDQDRDRIPDKEDRCPKIAGSITAKGCPDMDGDGVEDAEDLCIDQKGLKELGGCPDTDADGLADKEDRCPNAWGPECTGGCPDADEDCVADTQDECPTECGVAYANGCPDTDEDKIRDSEDWCPLLAGPAWKGGCPLMDTDGDGIIDEKSIFAEAVVVIAWDNIWKKIEMPHRTLQAARQGMLLPNYKAVSGME